MRGRTVEIVVRMALIAESDPSGQFVDRAGVLAR
jgi:hypothetical protein